MNRRDATDRLHEEFRRRLEHDADAPSESDTPELDPHLFETLGSRAECGDLESGLEDAVASHGLTPRQKLAALAIVLVVVATGAFFAHRIGTGGLVDPASQSVADSALVRVRLIETGADNTATFEIESRTPLDYLGALRTWDESKKHLSWRLAHTVDDVVVRGHLDPGVPKRVELVAHASAAHPQIFAVVGAPKIENLPAWEPAEIAALVDCFDRVDPPTRSFRSTQGHLRALLPCLPEDVRVYGAAVTPR